MAAERSPPRQQSTPAGPPTGIRAQVLRLGRRIAIAIAGGTVVLAGLLMAIPLVPGQGFLVILLGLAILSLEFERPRALLAYLKARGTELKRRLAKRWSRRRDS